MALTIATGWSPQGWADYAHRFVESFERYWPAQVRCVAYVESAGHLARSPSSRIQTRSVLAIPGCAEFLEKYREDKRANGRQVLPTWSDRARAARYNFKFDAWKFCRQGFIPQAAALELPAHELLCWLDADVVTQQPIPPDFIAGLLPADRDLAYLGREPKHSEIGFQLYRLPQAGPMLAMFAESYRQEVVFSLREWHSAYVFDFAREQSRIAAHNLTPGGSKAVFESSPLGRYMTHLKGDRKFHPAPEKNFRRRGAR